jgi:hypothetical protein
MWTGAQYAAPNATESEEKLWQETSM